MIHLCLVRLISPLNLMLLLCPFVFRQELIAQRITVEALPGKGEGEIIYSMRMTNTSTDSILVLHAQEADLPPFINNYKWEPDGKDSSRMTVFLGRSDNPYLPESYRATKTLPPQGQLQLYFRMRKAPSITTRNLTVYFSMLSDKYYDDFLLLEKTGSDAALKRCKSLKQKHGVVRKLSIPF
ncbi:MAG: hypothetical protein ACKORE_08370 [Bacteroidota bacterium]